MAGRASLRSVNRGDVIVRRVTTNSIGRRSFAFSAPVIWNSLNPLFTFDHPPTVVGSFRVD